ncbi:MAG: 23S rRNA (guanosine(2251)-2'-O)-methyltransferase RlmB [Chlamydiota bacterium]|nr:23S rRNA (guanosine(2251)-2'-O)-methyltransferase RlmB [Chlamydiota bacterium]
MKKNRVDGRYIMGVNCVDELIKSAPERIKKIYTTNLDSTLEAKLEGTHISTKITSKHELTQMVNSDSHQSIVALVKEKNRIDLKQYLEKSFDLDTDLILILDSINDPQNLGTLLRAAECFGAGAVMWSKNRGVDLTPVVSKTSVGASELMTILRVSNLVDAVKKCQKEGYEVVTAEVGKDAKPLHAFTFPRKTVLIMGSEGAGVRPLLSKQADHRLFVPMAGAIDSLNVSQATSVFLYQWKNSLTNS